MTKEQFYNMIATPAVLQSDDVQRLNKVLADYPYFQAGWMLMLKGLHNMGDSSFSKELRRASIHVNNRTSLYKLINAKVATKPVEVIVSQEEIAAEEPSATEIVVSTPVEHAVDYALGSEFEYSYAPMGEYKLSADDEAIDENGIFGFTDWLDYLNNKPQPDVKPRTTRDRNSDLIDSFLNLDCHTIGDVPEEKLFDDTPSVKTSAQAAEESANSSLLTETLASIYVKQKNYSRAIEIYKGLSLKNPEKSVYFASRIKEIEKLID